ncbi:hypothetical protein VKS41_002530 [Umbelopsis sp. WA50703]
MVFNSYSRIENEAESLLDSVPSVVSPTSQQQQRDRSMSSPPRPSIRPSNRNRAISDPYFGQSTPSKWQPLEDLGDEETGGMYDEDDQEDLLVLSRPSLTRKKSSGLGLFKQNVLKAVGIKS